MIQFLQKWGFWACTIAVLLLGPYQGKAQFALKKKAQTANITPDLLLLQRGKNTRKAPDPSAPVGLKKVDRFMRKGNTVAIEAAAAPGQDGQTLLKDLQALGLTEGIAYKHLVFGYMPVDKLDAFKNVKSLRFARPAYKPMRNVGVVASQGDRALRADTARKRFGVTGAGTKIGILSDSYNALDGAPAGVASGDLPPNVQVIDDDLDTTNTDEGRAMAEIVHDVAPGAAIAFNTAVKGQAGFAKGIKDLAAAGCNIIVDDIGYLFDPYFQDGIIAQAVNEVVRSNGVTYFSAAGNDARSSYQSPYVQGTKLTFTNPLDPSFGEFLGYPHDFGSGDSFQKITIPAKGELFLVFQWSDPFYSVNGGEGAQTDMDLLVYYQGQLQPDLSSVSPSLGDDPVEGTYLVNYSNTPIEIEIALTKYEGPNPLLIKWINYGSPDITIEHDTKSSTIFGHPNAAEAIAVGASYYTRTPAFNPALPTAIINYYSSAGGTPVLFDSTGQRLLQPEVRQKPEIVAVDAVNTSFFFPGYDPDRDGFPNFTGTSAAAPHAAAVAALMQEKARNNLAPKTVLSVLEQTALDMDDPLTPEFDTGFDFRTGYGFIQADRALQALQPLVLLDPLYDCGTGAITFRTTGGTGSTIEYMASGVTVWTTNPVAYVEEGLRRDPKVITLMARQNGVVVTREFDLAAVCREPLTLLEPRYDCETGELIFRSRGGNGSAVEYMAAGVTDWTSDPSAYVEAGLRRDPKVLTLMARQNGVVTTLEFDFAAYCQSAGGRLTQGESTETMRVRLLGNPTSNALTVEVTGVSNQPLNLQLTDMQGRIIESRRIDQAGSTERHSFDVSRQTPGLLLLQTATGRQKQTFKVLKR